MYILIGGIHHNTLGVIRALGEHGVNKDDVYLIILSKPMKGNLLTASRFINKRNVRYALQEDVHTAIIDLVKDLKNQSVVLSCCDEGTAAIYQNYEELSKKCFLPGVILKDKISIMNKDVQGKYALDAGLNVPKSIVYHGNPSELHNWNSFPSIIKPLNSAKNGGGKDEIFIVDDKNQLINKLINNEAQIQEYIQKEHEYQLIGVSLNNGEIIIIPGFTEIIRQPKNTNTGYLKYSPINKLNFDYEAVKKFIGSIGYSGLFSVEFIRDKEGKDYFLEINMRNDGNAYVVTKAGVNLPYLWVYYNLNKCLPQGEPIGFNDSIFFIPELQDFRNVLSGEVGPITWLSQFKKSKAKAVWNIHDMKPFFSMLYQKILK